MVTLFSNLMGASLHYYADFFFLIPVKNIPSPRMLFFAPLPALYASFSSLRLHASKVFEQIADSKSTIEREPKPHMPSPGNVSRLKRTGHYAKPKKGVILNSKTKVTRRKKRRSGSDGFEFKLMLDFCSKSGDAMEAISIYDEAVREGLQLQLYHYNVLLYLCSSAAIGIVYPGKSGSCNIGCPNSGEASDYKSSSPILDKRRDKFRAFDRHKHLEDYQAQISLDVEDGAHIQLGDDMRAYARRRGFEIYERMCLEKVPLSEAAMTSVARMAMSMGDGDMAFEIVKQMKSMGINPRHRSYSPAIVAFCRNSDVDKAFEVERHMLESGITPEEPELEVLLRASVLACRGDKVYYLLHRLRATVRQVSPSTAGSIKAWFRSSTAARVGKRKIDNRKVEEAMESGGGGWHGLGWLGKGKWNVVKTNITDDGACLFCGEKLVNIDLDLAETEKLANSVASIAKKWEKNPDFENFQKWLDYHGPFEAIIDAANVGLSNKRRLFMIKVNAIANGIRQKLPLNKQPLIIVYNKHFWGRKMNEPHRKKLVKWENATAIYATPTGSYDDWYWLYAAIKCKSLVVTNDEMRDHAFQLLGKDFFPKWKERHQVRFSFKDRSFQFHMPSACSVVIQESEKGHWHIPIVEDEQGTQRTWMCVTRANMLTTSKSPSTLLKGDHTRCLSEDAQVESSKEPTRCLSNDIQANDNSKLKHPLKNVQKQAQSRSVTDRFPESHIVSLLEAAEKLSSCVIDFQI